MRRWLSNFFALTPRQAGGTIVLLALMSVAAAAPWLYDVLTPPGAVRLTAEEARRLDSLALAWQSPKLPPPAAPPAYFVFDPNTATVEELRRLGLPPWLASRLNRYRQKGGRFRQKSDLRRLYGFPDSLYVALAPYVELPDTIFPTRRTRPKRRKAYQADKSPKFSYRRIPVTPFDINAADTTQLRQIRGIGRGYARRILDRRAALGGFVRAAQLREVWGLPDSVRSKLDTLTFVTPEFIPEQLPVNLLSADELARHPYVNRRLSRVIVAYRRQHGPYRSTDDLRPIRILSEEQRHRLIPYLRFDTVAVP